MEAHGHSAEPAASKLAAVDRSARPACSPTGSRRKSPSVAAIDRLDALHVAVKAVRRGGTVLVSGVYGGEIDPMPLMEMFDDRGIQLRMGQAHVKRSIERISCRWSAPAATRSA